MSLDNFRVLQGYGWKKFKRQRLKAQDKGHTSEAAAFISSLVKGTPSPISLNELFEVTQVSLELEQKRLGMEK